jgi:glutamine synthetase type III
MNAKIIFTYPIETIDMQCKNMIADVNDRLRTITKNLKQSSKKLSLPEIMEDINSVRNQLILVDTNLEEVYNILEGLVNYEESPEETEES